MLRRMLGAVNKYVENVEQRGVAEASFEVGYKVFEIRPHHSTTMKILKCYGEFTATSTAAFAMGGVCLGAFGGVIMYPFSFFGNIESQGLLKASVNAFDDSFALVRLGAAVGASTGMLPLTYPIGKISQGFFNRHQSRVLESAPASTAKESIAPR